MGVLKVTISTARPDTFYEQRFQIAGDKHTMAQKLSNHITAIQSGGEGPFSSTVPPTISFAVQENQVRASGTLTLVSAIATDAISINGVTFTGVASGATGNQFNIGVDDTATAVNLAAAINASVTALVAGYVTASSALGVVTVTSSFYGLPGNQTDLASADATITASVARLAGGSEDATVTSISF